MMLVAGLEGMSLEAAAPGLPRLYRRGKDWVKLHKGSSNVHAQDGGQNSVRREISR
jgi:hypothetical protein